MIHLLCVGVSYHTFLRLCAFSMFLYNVFSKYPIIHTGVTNWSKIHGFSFTERSNKKRRSNTCVIKIRMIYGVPGDGETGTAVGSAEAGDAVETGSV